MPQTGWLWQPLHAAASGRAYAACSDQALLWATSPIYSGEGRESVNRPKARRWMRMVGLGVSVLLIVAALLYAPLIRRYVSRLRDTGKTSPGSLSLLDKLALDLEYTMNKRVRGLGNGLYRLTSGRITRLAGAPGEVLLLTTRGRKSGREHTVMLQGFRDGADLVVVAANSGRPSHPDWFYNLKATPTARVQVMDRIARVHAQELSRDEAAAFWARILRTSPGYARYLRSTSRPIPLVRLVPIL